MAYTIIGKVAQYIISAFEFSHGIRAIKTYVKKKKKKSLSPYIKHLPIMSSSTDSVISSAYTPTSLTHVHHLIAIKLTKDNYLLWRAQIVPYLRGQHLYGFLDGSTVAPLPTISLVTDGVTTTAPNPLFNS